MHRRSTTNDGILGAIPREGMWWWARTGSHQGPIPTSTSSPAPTILVPGGAIHRISWPQDSIIGRNPLQDGGKPVILSAAKDLTPGAARSFAALRMTIGAIARPLWLPFEPYVSLRSG